MWVNKFFLSFLLILALPTIGTVPGGSSADVGGVNHEVAEDTNVSPADSVDVSLWASVLSPANILGGIQSKRAVQPTISYSHLGFIDAYLSPALRMMGGVQTSTEPESSSPSDFWELAKKSEETLLPYVHRTLESAAMYFKSTKFTDITSAMSHIVNATATFRKNIQGALDAHHITLDTFTEELEGAFIAIVNNLEKTIPSEKAPSRSERAEMVDKILDDVLQALIGLAARYGIEEEVVTDYLLALRPQVQALMIAVGDINDQYPFLLFILLFCVAVLLLPQWWILRPLLSILGFGPLGPVKGYFAAWAQSYFFGAVVKAGSWFALLQAAGMGVLPPWAWLVSLVLKVPLLAGGVAVLCRWFNCE